MRVSCNLAQLFAQTCFCNRHDETRRCDPQVVAENRNDVFVLKLCLNVYLTRKTLFLFLVCAERQLFLRKHFPNLRFELRGKRHRSRQS